MQYLHYGQSSPVRSVSITSSPKHFTIATMTPFHLPSSPNLTYRAIITAVSIRGMAPHKYVLIYPKEGNARPITL